MGAPALTRAAVAVLAAGALAAAPGPPTGAVDARGRAEAPRPHIDHDPIPYGRERKQQMAAYSQRHYGHRRWRLRNPSVIVLHFTGGWPASLDHAAKDSRIRGRLLRSR